MGDKIAGIGNMGVMDRMREHMTRQAELRAAEGRQEMEARRAEMLRRLEAARAHRDERLGGEAPARGGGLGARVDTTA